MLPKPCAVHINCKRLHLPLTSETHYTETARRTLVRDHYGAATEGSRRPVTSAPHVAHYARGSAA
jgi:hypothetical protein